MYSLLVGIWNWQKWNYCIKGCLCSLLVGGPNSFPKWLYHFAFLRAMYKSSSPCTSLQPLVLSTTSCCHFDGISKKAGQEWLPWRTDNRAETWNDALRLIRVGGEKIPRMENGPVHRSGGRRQRSQELGKGAGVAGAEAVGWVRMAVSGASDGAEPWRFIFLLSATEILIRL